jgi:RimJ/RimL family protein N-acetyltransferase
MEKDLFRGRLVRLTAEEPEIIAQATSLWNRDSEYQRWIRDGGIQLWSRKQIEEWVKQDLEDQKNQRFLFWLRTVEGNKLIGFVELFIPWRFQGDAWLAIGLGDRKYWGKGFGTEAIQLILRYAFEELDSFRVTLGVHEHNQRARRSYEKNGFVQEGRVRGEVKRDGCRVDGIMMGILKDEWQVRNAEMTLRDVE